MTIDDDAGAARAEAPAQAEIRNGMPFLGGRLWLDLVNTRPVGGDGRPVDLIATADGFAVWIDAAGIAHEPAAGEGDQGAALALRQAFDRLFGDLQAGNRPDEAALAEVRRQLDAVTLKLDLVETEDGYTVVERLHGAPTAAAAVDFAQFLCDYEPDRLKRCANPACTMVFYDIGRNNRRRWCSMALCGNRDKVARFRRRHSSLEG